MFLLPYILFTIASAASFAMIYYNWSHVFSQQIISVALLATMVVLGKFNNSKLSPLRTSLAILITAFLAQVLVISSGGLYSPLLIVVHIYALGAIFLLNNKSPIFFLLTSLGVLAAQLKYDPILTQTFTDDPWTAVIYGLSFLIIIPLSLYLSHNYFIKDTFAKILKNYIKMQEQKESSILTSLNDLVIVTDPALGIMSINVAVEKYLQIDKNDILGKQFFDIFKFKDMSGNPGTTDTLSVNAALADKASRFVEGFMLETEANIKPRGVLIQVRPLADAQGNVTQIVFVLSEPAAKREEHSHTSIKEALKRKNELLATFSHIEPRTPFSSIKTKIGLLSHIEEDILLAQELEDHNIEEKPKLVDVVVLTNQILEQTRPLADFLAVSSSVTFEDPENIEESYLRLKQSQTSDLDMSPSLYSTPIEQQYVGIVIAKLVEMGLLTASATSFRQVEINLSMDVNKQNFSSSKNIYLQLLMPNPGLLEQELADFFVLNNPVVGQKTHLAFGSGLEGFIFKKLCTLLNMPFKIELAQNKAKIKIEIAFTKGARTQ